MSLDPLNSFFSRFKHITPPDEFIRKKVCDFVLEKFKIQIKIKDVSIRNGVIYLSVKPTLKSEVFIRKEELLSYIKEKTNIKTLYDVR